MPLRVLVLTKERVGAMMFVGEISCTLMCRPAWGETPLIDALIFDFDGVIIDTETPDFLSWRETFQSHGAELDRAWYIQFIGGSNRNVDICKVLEDLSGRSLDHEAVIRARRARYVELAEAYPLLPGVVDYIHAAKGMGLKLGVASSSSHAWVDGHLERRGLRRCFDSVNCADDVARVKPDPELYLLAAANLGTVPGNALVIEDSANGVNAAKEAGAWCVAVPNPMTRELDTGRADLQLESLSMFLCPACWPVSTHWRRAAEEGRPMCGRYALTTDMDELQARFGFQSGPGDYRPRYNVAPGSQVLAVVNDFSPRRAESMRWGLIPSWAKDPKIGYRMINAVAETAADKPAFRAAFRRRRCLALADGFYEWRREGKARIPHYVTLKSGEPFAFAGLWETWQSPEGETVRSCSILTTGANGVMAPIHHRMPVILSRETEALWLDPLTTDPAALAPLLAPAPEEALAVRIVSGAVNSPRNDGPECIAPAAAGLTLRMEL